VRCAQMRCPRRRKRRTNDINGVAFSSSIALSGTLAIQFGHTGLPVLRVSIQFG
jgi:hypothetical protein